MRTIKKRANQEIDTKHTHTFSTEFFITGRITCIRVFPSTFGINMAARHHSKHGGLSTIHTNIHTYIKQYTCVQ